MEKGKLQSETPNRKWLHNNRTPKQRLRQGRTDNQERIKKIKDKIGEIFAR